MTQNEKINDESKIKNRVIFFIAHIVLIGGSLILILIGGSLILELIPSLRETIILATTVKPETFTELYFEDHLSLPSEIYIFKNYQFKFTIHNLENQDMEYPYEVYFDMNGEKQFIEQSSVFIKNSKYRTISEEFTFTLQDLPTERLKVVVNLINKNQQIHFWMGD